MSREIQRIVSNGAENVLNKVPYVQKKCIKIDSVQRVIENKLKH